MHRFITLRRSIDHYKLVDFKASRCIPCMHITSPNFLAGLNRPLAEIKLILFYRCHSGCVRFPDFTVESITSSDLVMLDFCEMSDGIPNSYTINVGSKYQSK